MVTSIRDTPEVGTTESFRKVARTPGEQHLLSVTSLSLALGAALELSEGSISDLGVAAMLHDVGYTKVPDRTGHCGAGARQLLRQRGFHEA
jgi:predicted HD phosphohydrolase